jgi:Uma2 family endonuclease
VSLAAKKTATVQDYLAEPESSRVELLRGALVEREATGPRHGRALLRLGASVTQRFDRKPGGRFPGGWWTVSDVAVRFDDEVLRPDLAGWRRERHPVFPLERPVVARPDWVCEVLSPSNARTDRVLKLRTYHQHEVLHYWLVDPEEQTLTVFRYGPGGYVVVLTATAEEQVNAEPFESLRFSVGNLFSDEPSDDDVMP